MLIIVLLSTSDIILASRGEQIIFKSIKDLRGGAGSETMNWYIYKLTLEKRGKQKQLNVERLGKQIC